MSIGEIKKLAKETLKTSFGKCGLAIIIFYACTFVMTFIDLMVAKGIESTVVASVISIICLIVDVYLVLGLISFFFKLSKGEEASVSEIFKGKKNFIRFLIVETIFGIAVYVCSVVLDNILFKIFISSSIEPNTLISRAEAIRIGIVSIVSLLPAAYLTILFSQVPYVFLDNPEQGIGELAKNSIKVMKGNKLKYLLLILSFIGWFLIIALVGAVFSGSIELGRIAGIVCLLYLTFFLLPYILLSQAYFYNGISENKEEVKEEKKEEIVEEQNQE